MEQGWVPPGYFALLFSFSPYGEYRHGNDPPEKPTRSFSRLTSGKGHGSFFVHLPYFFIVFSVIHPLSGIEPFLNPFRQTTTQLSFPSMFAPDTGRKSMR